MIQHDPPSLIQACLQKHRDEIIHLWAERLNSREKKSLCQIGRDVELGLAQFFDEILSILNGGTLNIPPLPSSPIPLDAAKNEVHILLMGEEVFVETLKKHLKVFENQWLSVRQNINRAFHTALRNNSESTCDCCHWTKNESLAELSKLESELKKDPGFIKYSVDK